MKKAAAPMAAEKRGKIAFAESNGTQRFFANIVQYKMIPAMLATYNSKNTFAFFLCSPRYFFGESPIPISLF